MQKALKREVAYDLSRFDNRSIVREQVAREKTSVKQESKAKIDVYKRQDRQRGSAV